MNPQTGRVARLSAVAAGVALVAALAAAIAYETPERRPVVGVLGVGIALGAIMFTTEDH